MVPQFLNGIIDGIPLSILDVLYENLIQMVYHLGCLDLGVILPNQIYASLEVFNRAIVPAVINYSAWISDPSDPSTMASWQEQVDFFKHSAQVPVMAYL
jgi:hypothetical protein